ncbi:MAG: hypothetical protein LH473_12970 [Chitinophagales bacterium]|nr:hypothetical protein [Chitinophagales bacterium]
MKNKILLALFFFIVCSSFVKAQVITKGCSNASVKLMLHSKTYVVLTGDENFDTWMKATFEKHWMVAPFQFVTVTELDTLVKSDKRIFFFPQAKDDKTPSMRLLTTADIEAKKDMVFILSVGGFKQTKYLYTPATTGTKVIAFFKFSPTRAETTAGMIEPEIMIAFMNQSIQTVIDNKIKTEVKDSVSLMICKNATAMVGKTLIVHNAYNDETIMLDDKVLINDKVLQDYPYTYQLKSKADIETIINDGSENFCYLFLYFPSQYVNQADDSGDIIVYDAGSKKILYYGENYEGPWVEKWEFKDLIYATKGKL